MFHSKLRAAIAQAFPSRYNWLTWPKLVPDFVDLHIEAYLTLRDRYEQQRAQNPGATRPTISPELRQAVTLLAKQQGHAYQFLALAHYLLHREVAAARKEADHYRQQAQGYEQVLLGYQRLSNDAIAKLDNQDNL